MSKPATLPQRWSGYLASMFRILRPSGKFTGTSWQRFPQFCGEDGRGNKKAVPISGAAIYLLKIYYNTRYNTDSKTQKKPPRKAPKWL